jgi:hypothetical protein
MPSNSKNDTVTATIKTVANEPSRPTEANPAVNRGKRVARAEAAAHGWLAA